MIPKEKKQQVVQNIQDLIDKYENIRDGNDCSMLFLFANLKNVLWVGDEQNEKHSDLEYFKRLRDLIETDGEEAPTPDSEEASTSDEPTKYFRLPTDEDTPKLSNAGHAVSITITIGESPIISSMAAVPNNEKQQVAQNLIAALNICHDIKWNALWRDSYSIDNIMSVFDRPLWVGEDRHKSHTNVEYLERMLELTSN